MLWLDPNAPISAGLIDGLRDRTRWRVELYRPDGTEPYQAGYSGDAGEARAAVSQIVRTGNGDIVRVIAPPKATPAEIQALRDLGAVLT
jgi:hypothetical protein